MVVREIPSFARDLDADILARDPAIIESKWKIPAAAQIHAIHVTESTGVLAISPEPGGLGR